MSPATIAARRRGVGARGGAPLLPDLISRISAMAGILRDADYEARDEFRRFNGIILPACSKTFEMVVYWSSGLPAGVCPKIAYTGRRRGYSSASSAHACKCPSTLSVKVPGQSASGLGVTRRTTPPPRRAAERAPFIVAQLT